MKTYINTQQAQVPSYNLEVASNAFNKLNEGHIQAIQAQSELQNAVAQLDLNETEDDFRQQLVNEIDFTVRENTRYNNAYFALPDIIAKAGNINTNPELIGRLRAQQAYKANIDAIDARTDVNDAAKEMAKALSPYYYRDKQTGELINNGVWKPGYSPVKSYDTNQILQLVGQYVSPDEGGFSSPISFLNADGSISDHWDPAGGLGVLEQQTGEWKRLSKEKIKSAWDAALAANPGIMASLKQDYEVANWNLDTKGEDIYNIIGQDGSRITFNDFVNRIIDPYVKAKSYYNKTSSITYDSNTLKSYATLRAAAAQQQTPSVTINTPGNLVEVENDTISRTNENITSYNNKFKQGVTNRLQGTGYAVDLNSLNLDNREQTRQTLVNAGLPVEEIDAIMTDFDRYAKITYADRKYMNDLYNSMSDRGKAARKISDDLLMGIQLDKDYFTDNNAYDRWIKDYGQTIDRAFQYNNIYYGTENSNEYKKIISLLGQNDTVKNLGFKTFTSNGKYYIGLDKENSNLYFKLARAIRQMESERTGSERILNNIIEKPNQYYIDENGKVRGFGIRQSDSPGGGHENIFARADNFLSRMERIRQRNTPDDLQSMIVESTVSPGGTIEEVAIRGQLAGVQDSKRASVLKTNLDAWDENLRTAFATKGVINTNVRKISDNRKNSNRAFVQLTGKEVVDLEQSLQNPDTVKKIQFSIMELPTGDVYTVATVPIGEGKDKSSIKVLVDDISSPATDRYKNNPSLISASQIYKSSISNKPEQIAFYTDDLGNTQNVLLYPTMAGDNSFYVGYGDEINDDIVLSYEDASYLKEIYNFLLNPSSLVTSNREEYETKANKYLTDFQTYFGNIIPLPNYASTDVTPIIDEITR